MVFGGHFCSQTSTRFITDSYIWFPFPSLYSRFGEHSSDSVCTPCQSQQLLQPLDIHDFQWSPPAGFFALPHLLHQNENRFEKGGL